MSLAPQADPPDGFPVSAGGGAPAPAPGTDADNARDIALMRATAGGDAEAFRALVVRWQGPLINFFYRSTRDLQTSEDLAQSVFIRLYRNASVYSPAARFSTFVFHIARNILINEHRRRMRKPATLYDPTDFNPAISSNDDSARRCAEIEEAFAAAIVQLPENQRTAILLHKQQDLGYEEIAVAMNTSIALVKTWIFRGRKKLKELLQDL